ncbi:MAG: signal peptidase II [Clostridia bacterium]|nr:signal peptidase II [Clostridia bacterium]
MDKSNKFLNFIKKLGKGVWEYLKQAKTEYIIIVIALAVDLISKGIIQSTMKEGETIVLIPNFLEFYFTYNKAAAFSFDFGLGGLIGQDGVMTVFIITTIISVLIFGFILYKLRFRRLFARVCFALIIGGALGNLYDRIAFSMVRDFIRIVYFGLEIPYLGTSFAVFNIADACLVVGAIAFVVYMLFMEGKDSKELADQKQEESSVNADQTTEQSEEKQAELASQNNDDNVEITEKVDNVSDISVQNGEQA